MKKKSLFLIWLVACMPLVGISAQEAPAQAKAEKQSVKQTVVLSCDIRCQGCIDKIMKNIAWEKGVKDIVCDLQTKTVTVTYDSRKTDVETLLKAFEKIGKPAKVVQNPHK